MFDWWARSGLSRSRLDAGCPRSMRGVIVVATEPAFRQHFRRCRRIRLLFATVTMGLALSATAIAQPAGPDQATNSQQPAVTTDLRAPDQVAPAPPLALTTDLRAPDQVAPASA